MPVNAPAEYFMAESKFHSAKSREEKIAAMEEMVRLMPRHHGSETAMAQLKQKLAKLKKEKGAKKKGGARLGVTKEGEAQVCILGFTNSGKSTLLKSLSGASPGISGYAYTTTRPEIGMMDYSGVKIQLVEIPSTFRSEDISVCRTAELILLLAKSGSELKELEDIMKSNFIRTKAVYANPFTEPVSDIKEKVWDALGLIIAFTRKSDGTKSPMALPDGSNISDFAKRIHKDFVKNFRFARLWRNGMVKQVGLSYVLEHGDIVEIRVK
ncbi:MAG: TGS domain-containing protein [Candidatus Aenigmarchaeota archaeon]|nr:TGS domain-containing protein [Candidatus Aenigmarchaeota archaeon]